MIEAIYKKQQERKVQGCGSMMAVYITDGRREKRLKGRFGKQ